jgi:PAS domain S-box-containing protein
MLPGFQAGIEAIDANVAVINGKWDIVATNRNWSEFGSANGHIHSMNGTPGHENYLAVLKKAIQDGEDTALKAFLGISSVMKRETGFFELEYPCHHPDGEKRWFNMQVLYIEDLDMVLLRHLNTTKQRMTAKAIEGSENRLQQLFHHSLEGILLMSRNGRIVDANPRAAEILQYNLEELLRESREGIFDPLDDNTQNILPQIFSGENVTAELRMKQKVGDSIDVELSASKSYNETGDLLITVIFREITHRKLYEAELAAEKRFNDSAINSLPGIFYVLDAAKRIVRWNRNFVRVLGYSDDEIDRLNPLDLFPENQKEFISKSIEKVFEDGSNDVVAEMITHEGVLIPFHLTGVRFRVDGRMYLIGTGIDLTKQKQLESNNLKLLELERIARKAAVNSRNEIEKMISNAPSPICFLEGPELRISLVNNAFKKIFGRFKMTGLRMAGLAKQIRGSVEPDQIEEVYRSGKSYIGEEVELEIIKHTDGSARKYVFNFILQPVKDENNKVYGIFIQGMDVTGIVNSRVELRNALREQQVLIEEVHHRVKNNLAIITGLFELQIGQETDQNTIEKLRDSQLRIYTMAAIHEMLYQNESLSQINFADYITHMLGKIFNTSNEGSLHIQWETDLDPVIMSVKQAIPLGMILNELATNSLKHAFNDGEEGLIRISLREKNGRIDLVVSDNGTGYDGFDEKEQNSRMGVTLVRLLSSQLGGNLSVKVNGGTRVGVSFDKDFKEMQVA